MQLKLLLLFGLDHYPTRMLSDFCEQARSGSAHHSLHGTAQTQMVNEGRKWRLACLGPMS